MLFIIVFVSAVLFVWPFIIILYDSVKPLGDIMRAPLTLPNEFDFENYRNIGKYIDLPNAMLNTTIICLFSLLGLLLFCSMAAYWCECYPTRFSAIYKKVLLVSMLVPFASIMIPLVKVMRTIGVNNTLFGVILTFWGIGQAFAFFIIDSSAQSIPKSLFEAARIDGAGPIKTYFTVAFPLMQPALISVLIMDLFWIWNDFTVSLIILNNQRLSTIQLAINRLFGAYASKWDIALPALVISILPVLIVYLLLQKSIIEGVASGAVKG